MINKKLQRVLLSVLAAGSFALMPCVSAETVTCTGEGEYWFGGDETPTMVERRAEEKALANALRQAGVAVESRVKVIDQQYDSETIETIARGIIKQIGKTVFKPDLSNGGYLMRAFVTAKIETNDVDDWFTRNVKERGALETQTDAYRQKIAEQDKIIADLQKKLAAATSDKEKESIRVEVQAADKDFLAAAQIRDGWRAIYAKNYDGALACFEAALKENPQNNDALFGRMYVYISEGKTYTAEGTALMGDNDTIAQLNEIARRQAIAEAMRNAVSQIMADINTDLEYVIAANNLLVVGEERKFVHDDGFPRVIYTVTLKPDVANLPICFFDLGKAAADAGKFQLAADRYTKAITLNPQYADAYLQRGNAYKALGDKKRAAADFAKAKSAGITN